MIVSEVFKSIQGESTFQGLPCAFIRLAGCNLDCRWCDTPYAKAPRGQTMAPEEAAKEIDRFNLKLVEITGGEPLLQEEVHPLIQLLLSNAYQVLIETNGSLDMSRLPSEVVKIMDLKCPSSGMSDRMRWENISYLAKKDQIKFVIAEKIDYDWASEKIKELDLLNKAHILFAPAYGEIEPRELAQWLLEDGLPVRLQLQLHKYIWGSNKRGV
ncbi:MAG: 7-carboxy-7-deazaguanine synthase [Planctomycetes bacterium DG_23]|nr:MAG: 7-carboxy-7-deazaguanine synthase [Planctomycetes bacterium DG_23]